MCDALLDESESFRDVAQSASYVDHLSLKALALRDRQVILSVKFAPKGSQ